MGSFPLLRANHRGQQTLKLETYGTQSKFSLTLGSPSQSLIPNCLSMSPPQSSETIQMVGDQNQPTCNSFQNLNLFPFNQTLYRHSPFPTHSTAPNLQAKITQNLSMHVLIPPRRRKYSSISTYALIKITYLSPGLVSCPLPPHLCTQPFTIYLHPSTLQAKLPFFPAFSQSVRTLLPDNCQFDSNSQKFSLQV